MAKINSKAAEDIISGGNLEFESEENLLKTFDKTLFYHVNFKEFIVDKKEILKFSSQIFVNVKVEIELNTCTVKEDEETVEYRTVGTLLKDKIDNKILEEQYNQFYKPLIEYSFTEYLYEYRIRRTVNKKTGLITNAVVFTKEEIKNNYQFVTQFDLRQVDF